MSPQPTVLCCVEGHQAQIEQSGTFMVQGVVWNIACMYLHTGAQKAMAAPVGCSPSFISLGPGSAGSTGAIFCGFQNFHCPLLDFIRTLLWPMAAAKASALNHTNRAALSDAVGIPKLSAPMCYAFHHQHNYLQEGLLSPGLLPPEELFKYTHTISAETGSKAVLKKQSYIHMSRGTQSNAFTRAAETH